MAALSMTAAAVVKKPGNGLILAGASAVDESMVTGESVPAEKHAGDEVIGGTLNTSGSFRFRAMRVGDVTSGIERIDLDLEA